jgi:hypothetical protein
MSGILHRSKTSRYRMMRLMRGVMLEAHRMMNHEDYSQLGPRVSKILSQTPCDASALDKRACRIELTCLQRRE